MASLLNLNSNINEISNVLLQWKLRTDIVGELTTALRSLGVDTKSDLLLLELTDLEEFISSQNMRMLDAKKVRQGFNALIAAATATAPTTSSSKSTSITSLAPCAILRVPEDCPTLKEALDRAKLQAVYSNGSDSDSQTIILGAGDHRISNNEFGCNIVDINSAVRIVGQGIHKTVVFGQINIPGGLRGKAELSEMSLKGSTGHGICAYSQMSLTNVAIEDAKNHGLFIDGALATCNNVDITSCGSCGIYIQEGGYVKLKGTTNIVNNCTAGNDWEYGLYVYQNIGKVLFAPSLSRVAVSRNNGGGGNWGGEESCYEIMNEEDESQ